MGIKGDWSRVKDSKKYGETIENIYGKRIKLPPKGSQEFNQLQAELLAILLINGDVLHNPASKVSMILDHLEENYGI